MSYVKPKDKQTQAARKLINQAEFDRLTAELKKILEPKR